MKWHGVPARESKNNHGLVARATLHEHHRRLFEHFAERTGIETRFQPDTLLVKLKPKPSTALYRVAQEALTNIERHSGASAVSVRLWDSNGRVTMTVSDNGDGFAGHDLKGATSGLGLRNMQERMAHFGGVLLVETGSDGTQLTARLPLSAVERPMTKPSLMKPEVA